MKKRISIITIFIIFTLFNLAPFSTTGSVNFTKSEVSYTLDYLDQYSNDPSSLAFKVWYKNEDSYTFWAQSFKPSLPILTKVRLKVGKLGSPPGNLFVSIRSNLSGEDLVSISKPPIMFSSFLIWYNFDFPDINVNVGDTYYIVCSTFGGNFEEHYYGWEISEDFRYWHGNRWYKSPREPYWKDDGPTDMCFETYGWDPNNQPPLSPTISGSEKGEVGTEYSCSLFAIDPDGDSVKYRIDWGDGSVEEWSDFFQSGQEIVFSHTFEEKGKYKISAKAKDINGAESNWGEFKVRMPIIKSFICNFPLLIWLYNHFPNLFPIFKYLFGL
jgi:hypothetical protein